MLSKFGSKHAIAAVALTVVAIAPSLKVVYEKWQVSSPLIASCEKQYGFGHERTVCLKNYFASLTSKFSPQIAIKQAINLMENGYLDNCHLAAHGIGEANLEKNNFDLAKAFSTCPLGCIEGCYHGAAAAYISLNGDLALSKNIDQICSPLGNDPLSTRQCLHGLGHGFLLHNSKPLASALDRCKETENSLSAETCAGGVFMENMNLRLQYSEPMLISEIQNICAPLQKNPYYAAWMPACINAIGEGLMFFTGHNLAKSKKLCESLQPEYWTDCKNAAQEESINNTSI